MSSFSGIPHPYKEGDRPSARRFNLLQENAIMRITVQEHSGLTMLRNGNHVVIGMKQQGGGGGASIPPGDRQYMSLQMVSDTQIGWDNDRMHPP